jgi:foldase protein PrsA
VTRTPRRLLTAPVAAGLAALVLTGCGSSPVRAGAAATVGQQRITTSELGDYVSRGLQDAQAQQQLGADRPGFERDVLARLINHDVLAEAAKREGVSITSGDVDARLAQYEQQVGGHEQLVQQAAQNGVSKQDLRTFVSDLVLTDALADELTKNVEVPAAQLEALYRQNAKQFNRVHAAHILVASQAQAESILAQVKADPSQFATLAAKYSTDTSNKDKGGDLGFAGPGDFVPAFEKPVFAASPGDYLVVHTSFGWHVVHVIDHVTTSLAQATPDLRRMALQAQRQAAVAAELAKVAKDLGVKVNPRFGRWDASAGSVVPPSAKSAVSSPAPGDGGTGGPPDTAQPAAP